MNDENIKILDPLVTAREASVRYLGLDIKKLSDPRVVLFKLLEHLVCHIMSLDCTPVTVDKVDRLYVVSTSQDWHKHGHIEGRGLLELFHNPVLAPELGEFKTRSEFLLYAYANNLVCINNDLEFKIKGEIPASTIIAIKSKYPNSCIIAFN